MRINLFFRCVQAWIIFTISIFGYSQAINNENLNLPTITPLSPEAASFAKYGNIPISYFRGTPNISLPLLSISDNSLTHNIGISYHSGGVKVSESASSVGMNWTLNAGGMITRQVRGIRDESTSPIGYLHAKDISTYNNQDIESVWQGDLDTEADIFTFNVGGVSGKFQFDQNGNIHVFPFRKIKIEPSNEFKTGNPNYWEITLEDGTKYKFGESGRKETTVYEPVCGGTQNSFISGWYITSIESFKGEKIDFVYDAAVNQDSFTGISETVKKQHTTTNPQFFNGTPSTCVSILSVHTYPLKEIKSTTQLIKLTTSSRQDMLGGGYKVDRIELSEGVNKPIQKRFDFEYFYTTASSWTYDAKLAKRMYLTSIKQMNNSQTKHIEQYKFDYFQPENLPSRISKSQDDKGFYNGKSNPSLIPTLNPNFPNGGDRSTSQIDNHLKYGSLQTIHYPTGGKTVFNFEPNEKDGTNVGGLRIKSIEDHDNNGNIQTKSYNYHFFGNPSQTSSMLFNTGFQYYITNMLHYYVPSSGVGSLPTSSFTYTLGRSNPTTPSGSINGGHIGYSNVTEVLNNGSYSEYSFSFANDFISSHPNAPRTSMDFARGQLLKTSHYTASGVKVKEIINEYEVNDTYRQNTGNTNAASIKNLTYHTTLTQPKSYTYTQIGINLNYFISNYFNVGYYEDLSAWVYLKSKRDITFYNGVTKEVKTDYEYGNPTHAQLTKTTITSSNNNNLINKIYYADDLNNTTLKAQHRIAEPIKKESFKETTKLSEQNTTYDFSSGLYLPKSIQTLKGSNSLEDRVIFHSYYDNGNVKEVSKKDGTHIVYIWGYHKTKPIAKIENATFTDIPASVYTAIVNASNADTSASAENTLRTELAKLRNAVTSPNLANAQITTYTYDPLIGVTSITDPRGRTTYYHYDSFNRLQYVKDNEGNIVSENQYNYKN